MESERYVISESEEGFKKIKEIVPQSERSMEIVRPIQSQYQVHDIHEKTNIIHEKTNIDELLDLIQEDKIHSKRVDFLYNMEIGLALVFLVSIAIFYKVLGLMAIPMTIFALGILVTSFIAKRKVKKLRGEYGIR